MFPLVEQHIPGVYMEFTKKHTLHTIQNIYFNYLKTKLTHNIRVMQLEDHCHKRGRPLSQSWPLPGCMARTPSRKTTIIIIIIIPIIFIQPNHKQLSYKNLHHHLSPHHFTTIISQSFHQLYNLLDLLLALLSYSTAGGRTWWPWP